MSVYSIRKCRSILREGIQRYRKKRTSLSEEARKTFEEKLDALASALENNDRNLASTHAQAVYEHLHSKMKKNFFEHAVEFIVALGVAILIAIAVRGMWFEQYVIPTGSMRPTFKEHDCVLVSKNSFGINYPLATKHFNFDSTLMHRGSIIVFTVDGLDIPDPDTTYFLLFKGKKRYTKRCMAKGGDTIYFYGGNLWGIDSSGKPIEELEKSRYCTMFEHIPLLSFEGKMETKHSEDEDTADITFKQMNIPIGKITVSASPNFNPKIMRGGEWVPGVDISSLWGINNFAMCRLINPSDLPRDAINSGYEKPDACLYLELRHSPELPENGFLVDIEREKQEKYFTPSYLFCRTTWIPLNQKKLEKLTEALYTCRFIVSKGYAQRYSFDTVEPKSRSIFLGEDIPDGTYEFFSGTLYRINYFSYAKVEPKTHPLYGKSPELIRKLFNCGLEFSPLVDPSRGDPIPGRRKNMALYPERYAYFSSGNLVVMGKSLFTKDEMPLQNFASIEKSRSQKNTLYTPFEDRGPPLKDGKLDIEFIKKYGLKIPEGHILALGDNHAMSGDSRVFGFVPYDNIQGDPYLLLWPFGDRVGTLPQPEVPFFRVQNLIILPLAAACSLFSFYFFRSRSSVKTYRRLKQKRPK